MNTELSRRRFRDLVLPHLDEALTYARWIVKNRSDAEDVTHDAFLRALEAIDSFRGEAPKTWLFTIVRNTAFTWMKRNRRSELVFTDDATMLEEEADADRQPSPEAALIEKQSAEQLERAISALPLPFREAVILRDLQNLSYRDIGVILGIPAGSVMSRIARGRARLAASLGETAR